MKVFCILLVLFIFSNACTDQIIVQSADYIPVTDLSKYNMKIIPVTPISSENVRLVIYEDCQYNLLSGVTKNGNTISIEKHFNSMMKLPCMLRNDTIVIGKLSVGSYIVNYKLLDLSTFVKDPVALAISFNLLVSK